MIFEQSSYCKKNGDTLSFIFEKNENLENAEKYSGTATFDGNGGYSIAE